MVKMKFLKLGLFNAQSLGTKHDELTVAVQRQNPDVLAINETWLRVDQDAKAPVIPGYRLRHVPRPLSVASRGGGAAFYIKVGINARTCAHPPPATYIDQMWISMNINCLQASMVECRYFYRCFNGLCCRIWTF